MQCIHRAQQTALQSYHIRWFFMCKWEVLSFLKLLHYIPFCWKINTGSQPTQLITKGWQEPQSGLLVSIMGLKCTSINLHFGTQSSSHFGIHGFNEIVPRKISSGRTIILNGILPGLWLNKKNSFRSKDYQDLNSWFAK